LPTHGYAVTREEAMAAFVKKLATEMTKPDRTRQSGQNSDRRIAIGRHLATASIRISSTLVSEVSSGLEPSVWIVPPSTRHSTGTF
jgi:hypothetical protein